MMVMFQRFSLFLLIFFAGFMVLTATAQTPSVTPHSNIEKIVFPGGYLQPANTNNNQWGEFKSNGEQNYAFTRMNETENGFDLVGPEGRVILRVNLKSNVISGEWPGHPMALIHKISKVERTPPPNAAPAGQGSSALSGSPALRPSPTDPAQVGSPSVTIVPSPGQSPQSQAQPSGPTPASLTRAEYQGGYFEKRGASDWVETTQDGRIFSFQQAAIDERRLYLYNPRRNIFVILEPATLRTFVALEGGPIRETTALSRVLGDGSSMTQPSVSNPQTSPVPNPTPPAPAPEPEPEPTPVPEPSPTMPETSPEPQPPVSSPPVTVPPISEPPAPTPVTRPPPDTRLSPAKRTACLRSGGIIERAGILGAERCTKPFDDAGQTCSDSSECSGMCRAERLTEFGRPTEGVCQPNDNPFGCFTEVKNGLAEPTLCVD